MIDIIITVVLEVAKCLVPPLPSRFRFDYLRDYKTNFDKLDQEVGKLKNARDQVQGKVDIAVRKHVEKIKPEVEEWQNDVKTIIDEAEKLIEEKTNSRCFCPNLRKRHKQSKEASRKVEAITKLLQREEIFGKVSDPTIPDPVWLTSGNKDYEDFQSRSETLKDIWKALDDVNVPMIGVHGMGGIGKTTLVKEIGRQAKDAKLFHDVVFVEITDNPNIKYIQEEIAGYLGLNLSDVTESQRASKLHARLKNEKKILLILDNIWTADLNLERVGIPFGDDQKECKLLLTARDRNVLENMDSKIFHIASLGEEEAWTLFKKNSGDHIEEQEFKSLANDVLEQCGGLPIAIVTVAKALRSKRHQSQWKKALRQLESSSPKKFEGAYANAYKCIELSYNYLNDELKKTFLLCSLLQPHASILDLLKYVIGLDIFQSNYTMEEARDEVDALIHDLKDSSLLLDDQDHQRFSIHDFVREVAVSIAIREKNVFYVRNDTQWEWPRKDNYRKIFITNDNFSEFPNELECPQLESLFMMKNSYWRSDSLVDIPEKFFTKMVSLKVLDLFGMQLPSLSSSLHLLVNIQTLSLYNCKFEDIAIIGELQKLKILSLQGSNFEQLPSEIGQLVHLRLLDLSHCRRLKVIAPEVIKSLSQLEELCMRGCPVQWENACLEDLSHLSKLTSLEIDIEDEILPKDIFAKKLERYKISIGSDFGYPFDAWVAEERSRRALVLKLKSCICLKESQSIKNVEFLYLDELQGVANDILSELDKDGFSQLKHLCLKNNHQFMCIVDSKNLVARDAFPALEWLFLSNLSNLEKICRGQFTTESFCKLKSIKVEICDKLKNLSFPFSTAIGFQRIQKIEVSSCKNMEEIFVLGGEDGVDNNNEVIDKIDFSEMQSVILEDLPQFTSFYSRTSVKTPKTLTSSEALSNEIVPEDRLDTATSLFTEKVVFPKLEVLELKHMNFEKIWDSQTTMSSSYKNLIRLILENCQKLKSVFSSSEIKVLVQLQHLVISECNILKEIIAEGGGAEEAKFEFPRVTYLRLWELQELRSFYPGIHTSEWPMLKTLEIGYCEKVNVFSSEYEEESHFDISRQQSLFWNKKVVFPKLEVLLLSHMNFEKIWDCQFSTMSSSYKNLTRLILENCHKLKSVFSSSMITVLAQLQHLEISWCNVLKEIIAEGGGAEEAKFEFPRVTYLGLWELPELRTFYPGIHTSEWPILKTLKIGYCEKVNIFNSEYEEESHLDISSQQSLFLAKKINPNLEELRLGGKNITMVCKGQLTENHFSKLTIAVEGYNESINIPLPILKKLEKLHLNKTSHKEIFSSGEKEIDDVRAIQIKVLEISYLFYLKNMWKQDSKLDLLLQNLEILKVEGCYKLMTVVPPSASFRNLTTLEVSGSHGLTSLITSSTAKSLEQLREMKINNCKRVIEVVANEEHVVKDELVFHELKLLSLKRLSTLICFCSGNHTFKFPSLEELIVEECPNMTYFSGGVLTAPNLQKAKLFKSDMKGPWEGDLNTTIQQLHKTVVNSNSEKLTWQGQFPEHFSSLGLTVLEVIKDESSNIPLKILQRFNNLEKPILKSSSYKEIFSSEEDDSVLQNFKILEVHHCHNLKILATSLASFENLTTLEVYYCDGLRNLVTASTAKGLVRLERMTIAYCELMIEVVENREDEARVDEIVFNKLKVLSLTGLESLTSFCFGNYTFDFPALEQLRITNCPKVKVFSVGVLNTPKLHYLTIRKGMNSRRLKVDDVNTTIQEFYKSEWSDF